ncbi:MAG: hypothetical protein AAF632_28635 [Bacteroidota bacterium]
MAKSGFKSVSAGGSAKVFRWELPCHLTDLADAAAVYFRKRIGKQGDEKRLSYSLHIHHKAESLSKTSLPVKTTNRTAKAEIKNTDSTRF